MRSKEERRECVVERREETVEEERAPGIIRYPFACQKVS